MGNFTITSSTAKLIAFILAVSGLFELVFGIISITAGYNVYDIVSRFIAALSMIFIAFWLYKSTK